MAYIKFLFLYLGNTREKYLPDCTWQSGEFVTLQ